MKATEYRNLAQEFRISGDGEEPMISGYAAVFDSASEDLGGWTETIDPHAFDSVLKTNPDVRALWNHNPDHVLGRTTANTLSLSVDSRGLAYVIHPPKTYFASDLMTSMRRKDVTQSSFGFICKRDQWTQNPDGTVTRRILEFDELLDVSPVTYPAYTATSSTARSLPVSMPAEIRSMISNRSADKKTKRVDGEDLTAGDFVYVGDPDKTDTWSLPWHFSTEEKTVSHLRDALARFDQDQVIPESHKAEAYAKLVRLCKDHGIHVSESKSLRSMRDAQDGDPDGAAPIDPCDDICECACAQCRAGAHGICSADPQCDFATRSQRSFNADAERMKMRLQLLAKK